MRKLQNLRVARSTILRSLAPIASSACRASEIGKHRRRTVEATLNEKIPWRNVPLPPLAEAARKEGKPAPIGNPAVFSQSLHHTCRDFRPQIRQIIGSYMPPTAALAGERRSATSRPQNRCDRSIRTICRCSKQPGKADPGQPHAKAVERHCLPLPSDAWRQQAQTAALPFVDVVALRWTLGARRSAFCRKPFGRNGVVDGVSSLYALSVAFELLS